MKIKRLIMGGLLSLAMAVTFIPNDVLAAPQEGGETPEAVTLQTEEVTIQPEVDLAEPDELLQDYLDRLVMGEPAKAAGTKKLRKAPRRASLSGPEAIVYDELKTAIEEIAAGDRSSTIIEIPVTEIFEEELLEPKTAEDLGVEELVVYDEEQQRYVINEEAGDAFYEIYNIDTNKVNRSLLADLPYDLYWYDKSLDDAFTMWYGTCTSDYETLYFRDDAVYTFGFKVAKDYSASGDSGTYEVNEELPQRVVTAADTINGIVEENAEAGDLEKLTNYKDTICDLTSYNKQAAEGNVDTEDPWQLIWVFDEDPETTVVCEGYSKAFQYLCDRTKFGDDYIESHLMTGQMYGDEGAEGAGPHMWNVVRMDDEQNYLVDVTNSDDGTIGNPDWLFLKGYNDQDNNTYTFKCDEDANSTVSFVYDSDTLSLYDEEELALSVTDYDEDAAQEYREQHAIERNQQAADQVADLINQVIELGEITEDNADEAEALINAAREAYDDLTDEQKDMVYNYAELEAAETALDDIQADREAVNNVIDMINGLSGIESPEDVTDEVRAQIEEARAAYEELSEELQGEIPEDILEILENAEAQAALAETVPIEVGETKEVDIEEPGSEVVFRFIPEQDGAYIVSSSGEIRSCCYVCDEDEEEIGDSISDWEDDNFQICFQAKAGETYQLHCYLDDGEATGSFMVALSESEVKSIAYEFGNKNTLMENMRGVKDTDEEGNPFFLYYDPRVKVGDQLTVVDKNDNSTIYTYKYSKKKYTYQFISDDGNYIDSDLVSFESDQGEKHWGVGSDNEVIVSYMGAKTKANITITENPVTGLQFAHEGKNEMPLVQNRDGEWSSDYNEETDEYEDFYKYRARFREGDTLTLEGSGGPCGTYTWLDKKGGFYLKGQPLIEEDNSTADFWIDSDQSPATPWIDENETYAFQLTCYGQICDVPVKLIANPIESIEYDGNPASVTEALNAQWVDEEEGTPGHYEYSLDYRSFDKNAKLILTGNKLMAGTYVFDDDEYAFVCDDLKTKIDLSDFELIEDEQSENKWEYGATQNTTWSYEGIEFQIPVKLVENQVKEITFEPADEPYYIFEQKDQKPHLSQATDELWKTLGHTLTITKKDNTQKTYTFQKVNDESLEYSRYYVAADGDMISDDDLTFTTEENGTWPEGSEGAELKVSYMGAEDTFTMPVRPMITRIEYTPKNECVAYNNVGYDYEDGFHYTLKVENQGDILKLYDSDDENAEPALEFTLEKELDGEHGWETADGLDLDRIGYLYSNDGQPWEDDPPWSVKMFFDINHNYMDDFEEDYYRKETTIPVTFCESNPLVRSVRYEHTGNPVNLYPGIDNEDMEEGYSGYSAIAEGDKVRINAGEDDEKVYTATYDEESGDLDFVSGNDILDWTYVELEPVDEPWSPGVHEFKFYYYGVESPATIKVNIGETPITNVRFTPKEPIVWDLESTEGTDEDENGDLITVYRWYYSDEDAGNSIFHDGDKLTFTWEGTDKEYTYEAYGWDDGSFVDKDGHGINAPYGYEDDQTNGDPWDIGTNKGYVTVGGVRSEAIDITIKCKHRVMNHTDGVEATCTEAGQAEYWTCVHCGKMFADEEHENSIDEPKAIPASHDWGDWEYENEDLHKHECTICHEIEEANHTWDKGVVIVEPTEETAGEKELTCTECGGKKTVEMQPLEHKHDMEHHAAVEPSCTEGGNYEYWYCTKCEKYFKDKSGAEEYGANEWKRAAAGHSTEHHAAVDPTCTEGGNYEYWYCTKCEKYFKDESGAEEYGANEWKRAAAGHNPKHHAAVDPTCTKEGNTEYWTCETCNKYFRDKAGTTEIDKDSWIVEKVPHTPGETKQENVVAASCSAEGSYDEVVRCTVCNEVISSEKKTIEKTAHTPGETKQENVVAASCSAEGSYDEVVRCTVCNEVISSEKKTIEKTAHTLSHVAAAEPTRTKSGNYEYWYCEKCKKYFKDADGTQEYEGDAWKISPTGNEEVVAAVTAAETLVGDAGKIKADAYSASSYAAVKAALEELQKVLADDSSSADQITTATQNLQKAIDGLKMNQTLNVKAAKKTVKVKKLKKKAQSVKPLKVTGQKTTVTYKGTPVGKKAKKALKINAKTGKITVKKKTKKGTYKMKVTVTAAASAKYEKAAKTVTVTIKVK